MSTTPSNHTQTENNAEQRGEGERLTVFARKHSRIIHLRGIRARLCGVSLGTDPPPTSKRTEKALVSMQYTMQTKHVEHSKRKRNEEKTQLDWRKARWLKKLEGDKIYGGIT